VFSVPEMGPRSMVRLRNTAWAVNSKRTAHAFAQRQVCGICQCTLISFELVPKLHELSLKVTDVIVDDFTFM